MAYLLSEMSTSVSLDGQQRLVVKGRFAPRNFEAILQEYVSEYFLPIFLLMIIFSSSRFVVYLTAP